MKTKTQLITRLEQKLRAQENIYLDAYLLKKGVQFYEDKLGYDDMQRHLKTRDITEPDIPYQTRILQNVLRNIKQPNPTQLTNANDNNQFPVYKFLKKLLEPSAEYFKNGNNCFSVVEYLAMKYDESFPCEKNGFDEIVYHEGADIFRGMKKGAIEDLQDAFVNRGLPKLSYEKKHDSESISKTITASRYEHLKTLAKSFDDDFESPEVISFINQLPNNTWFDHTISIHCDNPDEFKELRKKYIPDCKF
jgi:hypothetical protein